MYNGTSTEAACNFKRSDDIRNLNVVLYGILTPIMIVIGLVGNILNILILKNPCLSGVCYFYMRLKVFIDILGLFLLLPTANKFLKTSLSWSDFPSAFFFSNIQLYVLNSLLGIGVLAMVAMTIERFIRIRKTSLPKSSHNQQIKRLRKISIFLFLFAFISYIPYAFTNYVTKHVEENGTVLYIYCENMKVTKTTGWLIYIWCKQVVFRIGPVLIVVILNAIIWINYAKFLANRRKVLGPQMILNVAKEKRLKRMLTSLSIFFVVCITPGAVLSGIRSQNLHLVMGFQIFRGFANMLEISFSCFSFYVFCLSSPQYRKLFRRYISSTCGIRHVFHIKHSSKSVFRNNNIDYFNHVNKSKESIMDDKSENKSKYGIFSIEVNSVNK